MVTNLHSYPVVGTKIPCEQNDPESYGFLPSATLIEVTFGGDISESPKAAESAEYRVYERPFCQIDP